jgi:hypothetical protein
MDALPLASWTVPLDHDAVVLEEHLSRDVRIMLMEALLSGDGRRAVSTRPARMSAIRGIVFMGSLSGESTAVIFGSADLHR